MNKDKEHVYPNSQALTKFNITHSSEAFRGVRLKSRHKSGLTNKYQKSTGVITKSRNVLLKSAMSTNHKAGGFYDNSYESSGRNGTTTNTKINSLIMTRTLSQGQFATQVDKKNIKNLLSTAFNRD